MKNFLGITSHPTGLSRADGGTIESALAAKLADLRHGAPIVVLIHGFKFSATAPRHERQNPFTQIFAASPKYPGWRIRSWPTELGFDTAQADDGLCIGFGWHATGGFSSAYYRAGGAGLALAQLARLITGLRPDCRINVMAHSLGARVALMGLSAAPDLFQRLVILGGAEFAGIAKHHLAHAPQAALYNVSNIENLLFDKAFEAIAPIGPLSDAAMGRVSFEDTTNTVDLRLSNPTQRIALAEQFGIALRPRLRPVCHWGFYTLDGVMPLYARILRNDPALSPAALKAALDRAPARLQPVIQAA